MNESDSFGDRYVELLWDVDPPHGMLEISQEVDEDHAAETMPEAMTTSENDGSPASTLNLYSPSPKDVILPFPTCNESPINLGAIASSTPFHGKRIMSTSSVASGKNKYTSETVDGNSTFDVDKQKPRHLNETVILTAHVKPASSTFVKEPSKTLSTSGQNLTFDAISAAKESDDVMELSTHVANGESGQETSDERLLDTISQTKAASSNKESTKKRSHFGAPRMNTAAISRIRARSSQTKTGDCNSNASNNSSERSLKKQSLTAKARKSLLPTANITSKHCGRSKSLIDKAVKSCVTAGSSRCENSATPTRRRLQEGPKRTVRSPRLTETCSTIPSHSSGWAARNSSAPVTRLASSNCRPSRLQKPTAKGLPPSSRPFSSIKSNTGVLKNCSNSPICGAKKDLKQSITTSSRRKLLTSADPGRNRSIKVIQHNAKCATTLAILLDHVVNKLDGLSAPELLRERNLVRELLENGNEINRTLSAQVCDLQAKLDCANDDSNRITKELLAERAERNELQGKLSLLFTELEKERQKSRQQVTNFNLKQEEMRLKLESEIARIEKESLKEYQELEKNVESNIQSQLEERIKPFVNAKSEVESLTAVLEIKNNTIHELQAQLTSFSTQRDELNAINFKVEQLTQKNEDLSMQLSSKVHELRKISKECKNLQISFGEERGRSSKLRQHNEELEYRLQSLTPSSPSFNPVFTASPAVEGTLPIDSTPRNTAQNSTANPSDKASGDKWPRSLSYDCGRGSTSENDNSVSGFE